MSEPKEVLEKEIKTDFLIQEVKKVIDKGVNPLEIKRLYIKVNTNILTEGEIRYEDTTTHDVDNVLKKIKKLYEIYQNTENEKLAEGVKEEILKLIALLIWDLEVK